MSAATAILIVGFIYFTIFSPGFRVVVLSILQTILIMAAMAAVIWAIPFH